MANINQPLQEKVYSGVNVLDFSGVIAGSYCTKMLSDLGANVLKVEHPKGEIMRKVAPMRGQNSAVYAALNFGKRNIAFTKTKVDGISPIEYKLPYHQGTRINTKAVDKYRKSVCSIL